MRTVMLTIIASFALAGCAAAPPPALSEPPVREAAGQCDASGVQDHIGHTASAEAGAVLLAATGSNTLRWAPPRTALTMDYRPDRLTVSYDDRLVIVRITCG